MEKTINDITIPNDRTNKTYTKYTMVQPKTIKTSSTSQFIVLAIKILFVLIILFLLPKLVEAKKRRKAPPQRSVVAARKLRQHCETHVCTGRPAEESVNCISACLSPACFAQVYGDNPLEDGELDFDRALRFDDCFLEETQTARQRQRAVQSTTK